MEVSLLITPQIRASGTHCCGTWLIMVSAHNPYIIHPTIYSGRYTMWTPECIIRRHIFGPKSITEMNQKNRDIINFGCFLTGP